MLCCAYAKALHYKEEQFHKSPSLEVLESLISINNKLQNKEAAAGKPCLRSISRYLFCFVSYVHFAIFLKCQLSWNMQ